MTCGASVFLAFAESALWRLSLSGVCTDGVCERPPRASSKSVRHERDGKDGQVRDNNVK